MLITELIPNAKPIAFEDIRVGDLIARAHKAGTILTAAFQQTAFNGPAKWLSKDPETFAAIRGRDHYLVHRPAPAPPTTPGAMIRITDSGEYRDDNVGEVLTCNEFGDFIGPRTRLGRHAIAAHGIPWEQVWLTTTDPEEIVDAEVIDDTTEFEPAVSLPTGAGVLICITGGDKKGTLARRLHASGFLYDFAGISTCGKRVWLTNAEVTAAGWEAVTTTRDTNFYADQPF